MKRKTQTNQLAKPVPALLALMIVTVIGCTEESLVAGPQITSLPMVAAEGSAEPHLAKTPDGSIVMSWLAPSDDGVALKWSQLVERRWSDANLVSSGDNWFVNWADFPSVQPITDDVWAAHWLVKRPGGDYAYDVAISISEDSGLTWGDPITPHDDGTATEHGFVSLFPGDGGAAALWLDGRNMHATDNGHGHGGMTLRSVAIGKGDELTGKSVVDDLVCDCCQTDVAMTSSGLVAVYRNRTEDEIRDIYAARFENNEWQAGVPIAEDGWEIAGCPVNGPAIDANENIVATAWFTAANNNTKVRFARSMDAAKTFSEAIDVAIDRPIGRVDTVLLDDGSALVSWLRSAGGSTGEVRIRHVAGNGQLGPSNLVATTAAGRMSGFPQMVLRGNEVVIAWTDVNDEETAVRTAVIGVEGLIGQ